MTSEELIAKLRDISDFNLIGTAEKALKKLCATGGRSFTMTVPPQVDDTDLILSELIRRFELTIKTGTGGYNQIPEKVAEILGTKEEYEESRFHINQHHVELIFETALEQGTFAISTPVCDKPCGLEHCEKNGCIFPTANKNQEDENKKD